jgi:quercetin dioxygenase-like cupin family protein
MPALVAWVWVALGGVSLPPDPLSGTPGSDYGRVMSLDPVVSNPNLYRVVFENARVRVLEYADEPGEKSTPHIHPDSVMVTLSSFRRRLATGGRERDIELPSGAAVWIPAQSHTGENIGETETKTILVELKEPAPDAAAPPERNDAAFVTSTMNDTQPLGPD